MKTRTATKQHPANPAKTMALAFMGVGLLILAGLVLVLQNRSSAAVPEESKDYQSAIPQKVNYPAPELNLADLEGNSTSLTNYTGKVVLVNNWAFWCPPCRAELPELQQYYEDHKSDGFTIIGIESGGEKEDVEYHAELYKLEYPIWLDPKSEALLAFRNGSLPNSYVLDRSGTVRLAWSGPINLSILEEFVTPLIKEQ